MPTLFLLPLAAVLFFLQPVRVWARGTCGEGREPGLDLRLRPWIGLAGIRLFYANGTWRVGALAGWWTVWTTPLGKDKSRRKKSGTKERAEGKPHVLDRLSAMGDRLARIGVYFKRLWLPARRFASRVLKGFRLRRFSCKVVFGAANPATTGQVFGYFMAASSLAGISGCIEATPDFEQRRLDGEAEVEIRVYPHRLLCAVACVAWCAALAWFLERRDLKRRQGASGVPA